MEWNSMVMYVAVAMTALLMVCCDDGSSEERDKPKDNNDPVVDAGSTDEVAAVLQGPIQQGDTYVLEMNDGIDTLRFECQADNGGLITTLSLNGENVIADDSIGNMYGSSFWPSPQDWGWPPPTALDSDPYTVEVDEVNSVITLTSAPDPELNVQLIKRFSPDLVNMAINLEYVIRNTADAPQSYAPWEITRVTTGGLTFFPSGPGGQYDVTKDWEDVLPTEDAAGVTWFAHIVENVPSGNYKVYADGARGWAAHAKGNLLFVKAFADEPPERQAPNEGEVEIYVNGGNYEEMECQGAYQEIPSGGETIWNVKWYLRNMPAEAAAQVGNQPLVDFIDNLIL